MEQTPTVIYEANIIEPLLHEKHGHNHKHHHHGHKRRGNLSFGVKVFVLICQGVRDFKYVKMLIDIAGAFDYRDYIRDIMAPLDWSSSWSVWNYPFDSRHAL